jgi:hypothetical protein
MKTLTALLFLTCICFSVCNADEPEIITYPQGYVSPDPELSMVSSGGHRIEIFYSGRVIVDGKETHSARLIVKAIQQFVKTYSENTYVD